MKLNKTIINKLIKSDVKVKDQNNYRFMLGQLTIDLPCVDVNKAYPFIEAKTRIDILDQLEPLANGSDTGLTLKDLQLNKIVPFASKDEARPILTCINIEPDNLVATDSYRLLNITGDFHELPEGLYEAKALELALSIYGEEEPIRSENNILRIGTMVIRPTDGEYPNWKQLVPNYDTLKVTLPLAKKLKHPTISGGMVWNKITKDAIRTTATIENLSTSERQEVDLVDPIPLDKTLESYCDEINFNQEYFAVISQVFDGKQIDLGYLDHLKPVVFNKDNVTALLMPVRVR